jgi:hypothetical protein
MGQVLALAAALLVSTAQMLPLGEQICSDAGFVGTVQHQRWETIANNDPNTIVLDGIDHITFRVEHVLYGDLTESKLQVATIAHTKLFVTSPITVFVKRRGHGWWVAECQSHA